MQNAETLADRVNDQANGDEFGTHNISQTCSVNPDCFLLTKRARKQESFIFGLCLLPGVDSI